MLMTGNVETFIFTNGLQFLSRLCGWRGQKNARWFFNIHFFLLYIRRVVDFWKKSISQPKCQTLQGGDKPGAGTACKAWWKLDAWFAL
jgi:hypothetical protein